MQHKLSWGLDWSEAEIVPIVPMPLLPSPDESCHGRAKPKSVI